jgi:hypothetical protein
LKKKSTSTIEVAENQPAELSPQPYSLRRIRTGLIITMVGFVLFIIGAKPDIFSLDRSPVIGFIQIAVFEVGLAIICLGGFIGLMALWRRDKPSIVADFGIRFVATGYLICVFAGMADIFGFGSHLLPGIPYFGPLQSMGVLIGELVVAIGLIMLIPTPSLSTPRKTPVTPHQNA